jgi:VWFA-related protein
VKRRQRAGPLIATAALGALSLASIQRPVFRSAIDSVIVDVSVHRDNRPVADLAVADFEIQDNGVVQTIDDVRREALPIDVTLVVDLSGSVEGPLFASLQRGMAAIDARLAPGDRARVVTFNAHVREVHGLEPPGRATPAAIGQPSGTTSMIDALAVSLITPLDPDRRHVAILFSDGRDMMSFLDEAALVDVAKRVGQTVFAVAVADGTRDHPAHAGAESFLRTLTETTGGKLTVMQRDDDLEASFVRAFDDFRTSYVLRYTAAGVAREGWHALTVRILRRGDYDVRARTGYFGQ